MSTNTPFQPRKGGNQKVTASTTSAVITIGKGDTSIRALNAGAQVVYFRTYDSANGAETASTADTPIGPAGAASSVTIIYKPRNHDTLAYVADSANPVVNFQSGEGGY